MPFIERSVIRVTLYREVPSFRMLFIERSPHSGCPLWRGPGDTEYMSSSRVTKVVYDGEVPGKHSEEDPE